MTEGNQLWKYLQQQLNGQEAEAARQWIDASESNRKVFEEIRDIWEQSNLMGDIILVENPPTLHLPASRKNRTIKHRMRYVRLAGIAASLLLLASITIWIYIYRMKPPLYTEVYSGNQHLRLLLPDGSLVFLEDSTSFSYFTRMSPDLLQRKVFLEGKGRFEISQDTVHPFIVEADPTGVQALGTKFIVEKTDPQHITVENIEGVIRFYELAADSSGILMETGDRFIYDGNGFRDLTTKKSEVPAAETGTWIRVDAFIDLLLTRFDGRFNTGPYGQFDFQDSLRIELDQELEDIIRQLDEKSTLIYRKTCPDCYEIRSLKVKRP